MKGVVLAGGTGSRLRPLTYTMPKQMIPVGGIPVLEHAIGDMRDAGISEIAIVLGEHGHDDIKGYFGDGSEFSVDITYVYQGEPLGLGHAVGCAEKFVDGEPFVLFLGDDLIQRGITDLVEGFDPSTHAGSIAVKPVNDPSRYGIVNLDDDGDIVGMVEKPNEPPSNLAGIGVFVLTADVFDEIAEVGASWRGEVELSDAIHRLLTRGERFQSHIVDGWWYDVGTPTDVIAANRSVLDDITESEAAPLDVDGTIQGRIAAGSEVIVQDGATVRGPVSLGPGVEIHDGATVGPYTTLEADSTVEDGTVQSSVVLEGATVRTEGRILDSLVGRGATIDVTATGDALKLVVGTDSQVTL